MVCGGGGLGAVDSGGLMCAGVKHGETGARGKGGEI
jgi:hypothetical protein